MMARRTLIQLGRPESYSQHVTTVRPVHFIPIEGDVMRFVGALGYTFVFFDVFILLTNMAG